MIFVSVLTVNELTHDSDQFYLFSDAEKFYTSNRSFLFTLYNVHGFRPQKLTIYRNYDKAIYTSTASGSYGPTFGGGFDLFISNVPNTIDNSYSSVGHTYNAPYGCSNVGSPCHVFAGTFRFFLSDIEVFYETI